MLFYLWSMQRKDMAGVRNLSLEKFQNINTPIFLVINKIDQVHPDEFLTVIESYKEKYDLRRLFQFRHLKEIMWNNY